MRWGLAALFLLFLAACAPTPQRAGGDILVVGDSVMASNRASGRDIGSALASGLGRPVTNLARFGARIGVGQGAAFAGRGISGQLQPGPWTWVVMNGGANDLGTCGCTRCDAMIEALISENGRRGAIPDLINRARAMGARVVWLGYYKAPWSTAFRGCRPGLVEIERRIAALAAAQPGVFFLDAEDVLEPPRRDQFAADGTHPSARGAAMIGRALARLIAKASAL